MELVTTRNPCVYDPCVFTSPIALQGCLGEIIFVVGVVLPHTDAHPLV